LKINPVLQTDAKDFELGFASSILCLIIRFPYFQLLFLLINNQAQEKFIFSIYRSILLIELCFTKPNLWTNILKELLPVLLSKAGPSSGQVLFKLQTIFLELYFNVYLLSFVFADTISCSLSPGFL
jgi:hypothetical protein